MPRLVNLRGRTLSRRRVSGRRRPVLGAFPKGVEKGEHAPPPLSGAVTRGHAEERRAHPCRRNAAFRLWGYPDHPKVLRFTRERGLDYIKTDRPAEVAAFLRRRCPRGCPPPRSRTADRSMARPTSRTRKATSAGMTSPGHRTRGCSTNTCSRQDRKPRSRRTEPASAGWTSTGVCVSASARYGASRRHTPRPGMRAKTSLPSRLVQPWRFAPPLRGRLDFTAKGHTTP